MEGHRVAVVADRLTTSELSRKCRCPHDVAVAGEEQPSVIAGVVGDDDWRQNSHLEKKLR